MKRTLFAFTTTASSLFMYTGDPVVSVVVPVLGILRYHCTLMGRENEKREKQDDE